MICCVCENRNHVDLTSILWPHIEYLGLSVMALVTERLDRMGALEHALELGVPYTILDTDLETRFQENKRAGKHGLLEEDVFAVLSAGFDQIANHCKLLILYTDNSIRETFLREYARKKNIPVFLVQEGFLSVVRKDDRLMPWWFGFACYVFSKLKIFKKYNRKFVELRAYNERRFGHSRPDKLFVYGQSVSDRLIKFYRLPKSSIFIAGALQNKHELINNAAQPSLKTEINLNVLFADQCLVRNLTISEERWLREFPLLMEALIPYGPKFKFHPSEIDDVKNLIMKNYGKFIELIEGPLLTDELLTGSDVMVTYFSSGYIEALSKYVPVIFFAMPGANIEMPKIHSPMVRNVTTASELSVVLNEYKSTGQFPANTDGLPLNYFLEFHDTAGIITSEISKTLRL